MQPVIVIFDVISALAFLVALGLALDLPVSPGRALESGTKLAMVAIMALYVFVGVSNVLEHAGITAALDLYEDYAEVLFVPLIMYAAVSSSNAGRLRREMRIQQELRMERDFSSSVMDATPAGIVLIGRDGKVVFGNERARQLLGSVSEDAFAGGPVLVERDGAFPEPRTLAEIATDTAAVPRRFTVLGVEELRVLAITASPMAEEGMIVGMLDVTARVLSERELEQYRRDLEVLVERRTEQLVEANLEMAAANNAKKAFLANMSHELRTPLNAVIGFSGILLTENAGPLNEEQHKQLGMIEDAGHQLLALVNEVLDIARVESGHVRVEAEKVDLGHLLTVACSEFELAASQGSITMSPEPGEEPLWVISDRAKLLQILRNLLSNAIKFTPPGGEIRVGLERDGSDGVIQVRDTGVGIAPYDQGRVFAAFYQACPPGEVKSQGAGLGLSIVRQLSEVIGATVELQSTPGYGSIFTVRVPAAIPNSKSRTLAGGS